MVFCREKGLIQPNTHDQLQLLRTRKSDMLWKLQQKRSFPIIPRLSLSEIKMTDILEECDLTRITSNEEERKELENYNNLSNDDEIIIVTSLPPSLPRSTSPSTALRFLEEVFEKENNKPCEDYREWKQEQEEGEEEEVRWRFDYGEGK